MERLLAMMFYDFTNFLSLQLPTQSLQKALVVFVKVFNFVAMTLSAIWYYANFWENTIFSGTISCEHMACFLYHPYQIYFYLLFSRWNERKILSHLIHWRLISIVASFHDISYLHRLPFILRSTASPLALINVSIFKLVSPQILKEKQKVILFFTFLLRSRIISPTNSFLHCSEKIVTWMSRITKIKAQQKTNISHFFDNYSYLCHSLLALGRALIESATTNLATHTHLSSFLVSMLWLSQLSQAGHARCYNQFQKLKHLSGNAVEYPIFNFFNRCPAE